MAMQITTTEPAEQSVEDKGKVLLRANNTWSRFYGGPEGHVHRTLPVEGPHCELEGPHRGSEGRVYRTLPVEGPHCGLEGPHLRSAGRLYAVRTSAFRLRGSPSNCSAHCIRHTSHLRSAGRLYAVRTSAFRLRGSPSCGSAVKLFRSPYTTCECPIPLRRSPYAIRRSSSSTARAAAGGGGGVSTFTCSGAHNVRIK